MELAEGDRYNGEWLGIPIEDAAEETFLLFSHNFPSHNLGFIDGSSSLLELEIGHRTLTLKQSPVLLKSDRATGTTGAVLWKITPLIAEWLASMPQSLLSSGILHANAVVVELGCGIAGLIGILLAPLVSAYILTDQKYVMKILLENVESNAGISKKQRRGQGSRKVDRSGQGSLPKVIPLDWEADHPADLRLHLPRDQSIDLVVVCDCVYNEHLVQPLVETLKDVCGLRPAKLKPTYALIAQQLRSNAVCEGFLSALIGSFDVWRIPDEQLPTPLRSGTGYAVHLAHLKQRDATVNFGEVSS